MVYFVLLTAAIWVPMLKSFFINNWLIELAFFFLFIFPTALFFTAYSILLYFWTQAVNFMEESKQRIRVVFTVFNIFIFLCFIGVIVCFGIWNKVISLFLIFLTLPNSQFFSEYLFTEQQLATIEMVADYFIAALSIAIGGALLIYALKIFFYHSTNKVNSVDKKTRKGIQLTNAIAVVCTACFLIKGVALILYVHFQSEWIQFAFFYIIGETLPSSLMLFVFREAPSLEERFYQNLNDQRSVGDFDDY